MASFSTFPVLCVVCNDPCFACNEDTECPTVCLTCASEAYLFTYRAYMTMDLCYAATDQGGYTFPPAAMVKLKALAATRAGTTLTERPCQNKWCQSMNNVGEKKCWKCEVAL